MRLLSLAPVVLGLFLGTGLLAAGACQSPASTQTRATAPPKPLTLVALDRSGSTEAFRGQQRGFAMDSAMDALDRGNEYAGWVVDRAANCVYDPQVPGSTKEFDDKFFAEFKTRRTKDASRTRPALLWEALADKYGGTSPVSGTQPVTVIYLTDGGNDWAGDEPRITQAVQRLAQNTRVRVALVGVNPELKSALEEQFAPLAGGLAVWGRSATLEQVAKWRGETQ